MLIRQHVASGPRNPGSTLRVTTETQHIRNTNESYGVKSDRLFKAVTSFKDVVSAAGSIDPIHAGLTGFCVLMQVWLIIFRACLTVDCTVHANLQARR